MTMTPATASSFTPPPAPLAHARLDLLGGWRLTLAGTVSAGPGYRKAWALLAFLVLEPGRHSRERLAELLGIESPGHLRQLLSRLRSTLELAGAPAPEATEEAPAQAEALLAKGVPAAVITNEAVTELALVAGDAVSVLFKASHVILGARA